MTGLRVQWGATSVSTRAMPMLTGTPTTRAITEVTTVPYAKASAPNLLLLGSHTFDVKNVSPSVRNAGHALVMLA